MPRGGGERKTEGAKEGRPGGGEQGGRGTLPQGQVSSCPLLRGSLSLLPPSLAEFQVHQHFCPLIGCLLVWLAQRARAAFENPFLDHM